jgi:predicted MFS family arabinose efflux permease
LPEELIGDIASSLYNCFFALGATIGPCVSGFVVREFGFPDASALMGAILLGFAFIYFIVARVPFERKY